MQNSFKLASVSVVSMLLSSCGGADTSQEEVSNGEDIIAVAPTPAPSPTASPTPSPTPPPTETGIKGPAGYVQLASIPSEFEQSDWLADISIAKSAAPDVVGAFRFLCRPSHNSYDDPVVFPGRPGAAHLHTFFGNTLTDANSTYETLRTTGDSTCNNKLNRSAYWMPALMNGRGQVVMPTYVSIYYKRRPATDPVCQEGEGCIGVPRGLRYVFGNTMAGTGAEDHMVFNCNGADTGNFDTLAEAAVGCPDGALIGVALTAPPCWNGTQLDSADHRSHMAYPSNNTETGKKGCPISHPYRIPEFKMTVRYETDSTLDRSGNTSPQLQTWYFASDRMDGKTALISGTTFHADWFGAWDDDVLKNWTDHCIDKMLNCSDGNLGNGQAMIKNDLHRNKNAPRLVAVPPKIT